MLVNRCPLLRLSGCLYSTASMRLADFTRTSMTSVPLLKNFKTGSAVAARLYLRRLLLRNLIISSSCLVADSLGEKGCSHVP